MKKLSPDNDQGTDEGISTVNVSYNKVIVRKHIPFGKDRNLPL